MTRDEQIHAFLKFTWGSGGWTFGGTSRDLLRGDPLNDLDVFIPSSRFGEWRQVLPKATTCTQKADRGPAYYDFRLETPEGLSIDVKTAYVCVTDMDINLICIHAKEISLLYTPEHLKGDNVTNPLAVVLRNIHNKQFVPLIECEEYRKYRWAEFEGRGWKNLGNSLFVGGSPNV